MLGDNSYNTFIIMGFDLVKCTRIKLYPYQATLCAQKVRRFPKIGAHARGSSPPSDVRILLTDRLFSIFLIGERQFFSKRRSLTGFLHEKQDGPALMVDAGGIHQDIS